MFYSDQATLGNEFKATYIFVSVYVGVVFIIYWLTMPFLKPDPVLLLDDIVEVDDTLTAIPDEELTEVTLMD